MHRTLPGAPHPWGGMELGHRGSAEAAHAEEEGDGDPLKQFQPVHVRGCSGGKSCAMFRGEIPYRYGISSASSLIPIKLLLSQPWQEQGAASIARETTEGSDTSRAFIIYFLHTF